MKKRIFYALGIGGAILFTGCAGGYEVSPNMATLNAKFADSNWDGKIVPKSGMCLHKESSGGDAPSIMVSNLPLNSNKIVLTFSDNNSQTMGNGGHGAVSYKFKEGSSSITIPSFRSETFTLPTNFETIRGHNAAQYGITGGAYLAPCSGGKGHNYSVLIEAIHDYGKDDKKSLLVGKTNLNLGNY